MILKQTLKQVSLLLFAGALAQDKPTIALTLNSSLGNPTVATITNGDVQPATGFVLVLKRYNAAGIQKLEFQRFYDPLVNLPEHFLQPGSSVTLSMGSPFPDSSKPDDVQLMAAVFLDGKMTGDVTWARKILRRRRIVKNTLQKLMEMCGAYTASESGQTFAKRFADYEAAQSAQLNEDDRFVFQFIMADAKANLGATRRYGFHAAQSCEAFAAIPEMERTDR